MKRLVRSTAGIALVVAALATHAGAEEDAFPESARLERRPAAEPLLRAYDLPRRKEAADVQPLARARLEGHTVLFVDVDGNGRFDGRGLDGWTVEDERYRYIVPFEESITVGTHRVWLRFPADGKTVEYRVEEPRPPKPPKDGIGRKKSTPEKLGKGCVTALEVWNDLRLRNGLPTVWLDEELSYGCVMHSRYMARHGLTHTEDPASPLYTEAGARAAKNGNVGSWAAPEEIVGAYRSFYHRISLFHPATRGAGIGDVGGRCTFDGTSGRRERRWTWPVVIPAPSSTGVPLDFSAEQPVIHEDVFRGRAGLNGAGFPISLTFPRAEVAGVTADLRLKGPKGRAVEFLLSSPEEPGNASIPDNYKTIGLVPRARLKPRKVYWVRVAFTYRGEPGEREWTFTTGAK